MNARDTAINAGEVRGAQSAREDLRHALSCDCQKASIARSKAAKPDKYRLIQRQSSMRRRSRKAQLPTEPVSVTRVFSRDGGLCHLCGKPVSSGERSLDHLIPVVRGGASAEWNLATAHLRCNQRRGTRQVLPVETREEAEKYITAKTGRTAA